MNGDINPYRSLSVDISPTDFELFCMNTLQAYAIQENLKNFSVSHNQKVESNDGTYQIDVLGEFTIMGTKVKVIVECKKYSRAIERENFVHYIKNNKVLEQIRASLCQHQVIKVVQLCLQNLMASH